MSQAQEPLGARHRGPDAPSVPDVGVVGFAFQRGVGQKPIAGDNEGCLGQDRRNCGES